MGHVVGFVGYECEDIVLYLAKILCHLGKKVMIVDRTEQEILLEILELHNEAENTIREGDFLGIWITNQGICKEAYDVIFYLFGYRLIHPKLYECETLIMVTDGVPAHAKLLKKIASWDRKQYLLIRNLVPMKHTEQYLATLAANEKSYCELPYDERDIRMWCSLGSYAGCEVKHLSAGMKDALVILLGVISTEYSERFIRNSIKKI